MRKNFTNSLKEMQKKLTNSVLGISSSNVNNHTLNPQRYKSNLYNSKIVVSVLATSCLIMPELATAIIVSQVTKFLIYSTLENLIVNNKISKDTAESLGVIFDITWTLLNATVQPSLEKLINQHTGKVFYPNFAHHISKALVTGVLSPLVNKSFANILLEAQPFPTKIELSWSFVQYYLAKVAGSYHILYEGFIIGLLDPQKATLRERFIKAIFTGPSYYLGKHAQEKYIASSLVLRQISSSVFLRLEETPVFAGYMVRKINERLFLTYPKIYPDIFVAYTVSAALVYNYCAANVMPIFLGLTACHVALAYGLELTKLSKNHKDLIKVLTFSGLIVTANTGMINNLSASIGILRTQIYNSLTLLSIPSLNKFMDTLSPFHSNDMYAVAGICGLVTVPILLATNRLLEYTMGDKKKHKTLKEIREEKELDMSASYSCFIAGTSLVLKSYVEMFFTKITALGFISSSFISGWTKGMYEYWANFDKLLDDNNKPLLPSAHQKVYYGVINSMITGANAVSYNIQTHIHINKEGGIFEKLIWTASTEFADLLAKQGNKYFSTSKGKSKGE